jgi:hypothetical protein
VRGLSALCLLGVINAFYWGIKNQWMFEPATKRGGRWWIGDAAVGLACFILGPILWSAARTRSYNKLAATNYRYAQGQATDEEVNRVAAEHERDFG